MKGDKDANFSTIAVRTMTADMEMNSRLRRKGISCRNELVFFLMVGVKPSHDHLMDPRVYRTWVQMEGFTGHPSSGVSRFSIFSSETFRAHPNDNINLHVVAQFLSHSARWSCIHSIPAPEKQALAFPSREPKWALPVVHMFAGPLALRFVAAYACISFGWWREGKKSVPFHPMFCISENQR